MGKAASIIEIIEPMKKKFTSKSLNNDTNDHNSKYRISAELAEFRAQKLIDKYNAPQSRNFFLKCIYHLTESDIENAVELSTQPWVKSPIKYFVRICSNKLNG